MNEVSQERSSKLEQLHEKSENRKQD